VEILYFIILNCLKSYAVFAIAGHFMHKARCWILIQKADGQSQGCTQGVFWVPNHSSRWKFSTNWSEFSEKTEKQPPKLLFSYKKNSNHPNEKFLYRPIKLIPSVAMVCQLILDYHKQLALISKKHTMSLIIF